MGTRSRRKDWKPDSQGHYTRQIGWKLSREGKRSQHKFRLGCDLKQATQREEKLVALWNRVEQLQSLAGGEPLWDDTTLEIGCQLARGAPVRLARRTDESEEAYAGRVNKAQNLVSKHVEAADQQAFERGLEKVRASSTGVLVYEWDLPDLSKEPVVKVPLPSRPAAKGEAKTLHQALKDYTDWLRKTFHSEHLGRITANGFNRIKQVEILIDRHADLPLQALGHDQVEDMIRLWCRRPLKKGSARAVTRKSAINLVGELGRFFRWLHRSPQHSWRKPTDFDEIEVSVDKLPSDSSKLGRRVSVFSLEELILLNQYASPLERVFLLLGLNCGFGIAEIASLEIGEVHLFEAHEKRLQPILGFHSTAADSFIKRVRRKNQVYGEFLLFPQTVRAMQWALEKRQEGKPESRLLLNRSGEPYDKPTKGGNANHQIPNRFQDLLNRVLRDDNQIRKLSFNKLRKTAGDLIRQFSDGEVAGVFLTHGQPVASDDLLDIYTNRPFGKVFEAIRRVEEHLKPFFEAAGPEPFVAGPQAYTSRKTVDRIKQLREEKLSIREIAQKTGRSRSAVERHLARISANGKETERRIPTV